MTCLGTKSELVSVLVGWVPISCAPLFWNFELKQHELLHYFGNWKFQKFLKLEILMGLNMPT